MKVLIATNAFPTADRPSAGIFVRNQFRFFRRHATPEETFSLFKVRTHKQGRPSRIRKLMGVIGFLPHLFRRYDIVHFHSLSPLLYLARFYRRRHPNTRILLSIHGGGIRDFESRPARVQRRYQKALKCVDHVIASGDSLVHGIQQALAPAQLRVICAGVDDLRFHTDEKPTKEFDFIFVGSFTEDKGADILLAALNMLENQELRVCFVGSGPLADTLKRAGHHLDIQVFADVPQPRLRQLYAASRFLVFSSRGDGFGLVVSEAMYCGTVPIIYADSGASTQVIHGETGFTYKPNTPEKLRRMLAAAATIDDKTYQRMAEQASQANIEFSLSYVGTQLMQLYRQLAGEADLSSR